MNVTVKLPRMGETVDKVLVLGWEISVGDTVVEGDALIQVETDKAIVAVPAPVSGVVVEWLVGEDDEIVTGVPIAVIDHAP